MVNLAEGETYSVLLTVTNESIKAGSPVEVCLGVGIRAVANSTILIPEQVVADEYFAPGETRVFGYTLNIPFGNGGQSGSIEAVVQDPAGRIIAQAAEAITIVEVLTPVVTVALKNPPSGAENWSLTLTDWDMTAAIRFTGWNGKKRLALTETATFEIPGGVKFPLKVAFLTVSKWIEWEGTPALQQLYYVQSIHPYQWDFAKGDWSDIPDPTYKELFFLDYGSYYFNVATEEVVEF